MVETRRPVTGDPLQFVYDRKHRCGRTVLAAAVTMGPDDCDYNFSGSSIVSALDFGATAIGIEAESDAGLIGSRPVRILMCEVVVAALLDAVGNTTTAVRSSCE